MDVRVRGFTRTIFAGSVDDGRSSPPLQRGVGGISRMQARSAWVAGGARIRTPQHCSCSFIQPVARFGQNVHTALDFPTPEPCRLRCDGPRWECPQPSRIARDRRTKIIVGCLLLIAGEGVRAQSFTFAFDGPDRVECYAERTVVFQAFATVATNGIAPGGGGAEAWSMGITADGGTVVDIGIAGTASEIQTNDGPRGPDYHECTVVEGGAILAVILDFEGVPTLFLEPADGPRAVAWINVETTIPGENCTTCKLRYVEGLQSGAGPPVSNVVTHETMSFVPIREERRIQVCVTAEQECTGAAFVVEDGSWHLDLTLTPEAPRAHIPIVVNPELPLRLSVTDLVENSGCYHVLYVRWNDRPTASVNDARATKRYQSDQRLLLPEVRAQVCHVLVEATIFGTPTSQVRLTAEQKELLLGDLRPAFSSPRGSVTLSVDGAGLRDGVTFLLENAETGSRLSPVKQQITSPTAASLEFNLLLSDLAEYHLVCPSRAESILRAFTVVDPKYDHGLEVVLEDAELYRAGALNVVKIRSHNLNSEPVHAPLLKLSAPPNAELQLDRDDATHRGELLFLGSDARGLTGTLEPGAESETALSVKFDCIAPSCTEAVRVFFFTATDDDFIAWQEPTVPDGMTPDAWELVRIPLSSILGPTWKSYHERLAAIAARLGARKADDGTVSLHEAFRFAVRQAFGRPTGAITGTVKHVETRAPLPNETVFALEGDVVRSKAVTDENGHFVLDWLAAGTAYRVHVVRHAVDRIVNYASPETAITPPPGADLLGLEALVRPSSHTGTFPEGLHRDESSLPEGILSPPPELFTRNLSRPIRVLRSIDPNIKKPPRGEGNENALLSGTELQYIIDIENRADATAPAHTVTVTDQLTEELKWETARFQSVVIVETALPIYKARANNYALRFSKEVPIIYDSQPYVPTVDAELIANPATGLLSCTFTTDLPQGFLPPTGHLQIAFTVVAPTVAGDGSIDVDNYATVVFDGDVAHAEQTNVVHNCITNNLEPDPPADPNPPSGTDICFGYREVLNWAPVPMTNTYDVYLWEDGEDPPPEVTPTIRDLKAPGCRPGLRPETTYHWYVVAKNTVHQTNGSTWTFRTCSTEITCPEAPTLIGPSDGASFYFRPTLRWSPVPGASAYKVYLGPAAEGTPIAPLISVTSSEFALPTSLASGGYRWKIVSLKGSCPQDRPDGGSEVRTFTIEGFMRGDANNDRRVDISDPIYMLLNLFVGGQPPPCQKSANADVSDPSLNLGDVIATLSFLFAGGAPPPPPYPACGVAENGDLDQGLTCEASACWSD